MIEFYCRSLHARVDVSLNPSRNCLGPYSMMCKRLGKEGADVGPNKDIP